MLSKNDVEYLFMHVLAILIFFPVKYLFKYFTDISNYAIGQNGYIYTVAPHSTTFGNDYHVNRDIIKFYSGTTEKMNDEENYFGNFCGGFALRLHG